MCVCAYTCTIACREKSGDHFQELVPGVVLTWAQASMARAFLRWPLLLAITEGFLSLLSSLPFLSQSLCVALAGLGIRGFCLPLIPEYWSYRRALPPPSHVSMTVLIVLMVLGCQGGLDSFSLAFLGGNEGKEQIALVAGLPFLQEVPSPTSPQGGGLLWLLHLSHDPSVPSRLTHFGLSLVCLPTRLWTHEMGTESK